MLEDTGIWKTLRQVFRFLIVGSVATFADFVVYLLMVEAGTAPTVAKAFSYIGGTLLGFLGNKFWTFGSARRSIAEPVIYGTLYAGTLAVNVGMHAFVLYVLAGVVSPTAERGIAFVAATAITTAVNFLGLRFLAFRTGLHDQCQTIPKPKQASGVTETVAGSGIV